MKKLNQNVKETYTKDGKSLKNLIQEWINENDILSYCNKSQKDIEYIKVDKK